MNRLLPLTFLALVTLLTLFYKLGSLPFVGSDEPRYARIGEEMALSGDWVTPQLLGRPWLEKPPLLFWMEAASFDLFGVSEYSARLPNALLALLSVGVLALMVTRLANGSAAYLSCLVLLTSGLFLVFARAASTDLPLTATLTASLGFAAMAADSKDLRWAMAAGASLGLAVLAKGPVAILLFVGILTIHALIQNQSPFRLRQIVVGIAAVGLVSLPWFWAVWQANGNNFLISFWLNHHLARYVTDLHHHAQPFWFFVPLLLAGFFPWIAFLPGCFQHLWKNRRNLAKADFRLETLLWIWTALPFLFFSAGSSKLAGYIVPVVPPLAALVGLQWERHIRGEVTVYGAMKRGLQGLAGITFLLVPALVLGFHFRYSAWIPGLIVSAPLLVATIWGYREHRRGRRANVFLAIAGGMTLTFILLYQQAGPVVAQFHSTAGLVRSVKSELTDRTPLVFYRLFHHSAQYYADYHTTRDTVNNPDELRRYMGIHPQERYLLLTHSGGARELAESLNGKIVRQSGNFFLVEVPGPPTPSAPAD